MNLHGCGFCLLNLGLNTFDPPFGLTTLFLSSYGLFYIINRTSFMVQNGNGTSVQLL
jgi:hypothetical protein